MNNRRNCHLCSEQGSVATAGLRTERREQSALQGLEGALHYQRKTTLNMEEIEEREEEEMNKFRITQFHIVFFYWLRSQRNSHTNSVLQQHNHIRGTDRR